MSTPDRVIIHPDGPRPWIISLIIGVGIIGFFAFTIYSFNREVTSLGKPGTIVAKEFIPRPETQFTVGAPGGLTKEERDGDYILKVRTTADQQLYNIWVPKDQYDSARIGGPYYVVPKKTSR